MSIRAKRGTKAQVDAAAGSGGLLTAELIHLTDLGRLAVATGASAYVNVGGMEIGDVSRRGSSPGTGWLPLNGATYNKSTYPDLGNLINPGAGTTFTLPNVAPSGGLSSFIKAL